MTTEPKNELPDKCREAFEKWYQGNFNAFLKRDEDGYEDSRVNMRWWAWQAAWNARPAKAVQGDLQGMDGHDEPCAKCGVKCNPLSSNFTVTPVCLWIGGEFTTHCAKCVIAALTPESEGIAGKEGSEDYHKLCAQCWDALGIKEYTGKHIAEHIRELVTLTHPQEIDVEKLRYELIKSLGIKAYVSDVVNYIATNYTIKAKQ